MDSCHKSSINDGSIVILEPTDTDVLLGRGVSTNRHPGNVNFRSIVSEHVKIYVTSTKKQKMLISRSIVDKVRKSLSPPGRFLEKDDSGSAWKEVDTKKALEKTAQALRDGAFPLRKQLSEDFSDSGFLEAVFDVKDDDDNAADTSSDMNGNSSKKAPSSSLKPHPLKSYTSNSQTRGHRRRVSAPVLQKLPEFSIDELPSDDDRDSKRSKPNSPCYGVWGPSDNGASDGILTGVNFPSPGVSSELEFLIGTNNINTTHADTAGRSTNKKHHRRNRTFGGYSCSDRHVSDMNVDDIFALFVGNSSASRQQPQQQLEMTMNGLDDDTVDGLFHSPINEALDVDQTCFGTGLSYDNGVMANAAAAAADRSSQFDSLNIVTPNDTGEHLSQFSWNASSDQEIKTSSSPTQQDTMVYSPQASPSPLHQETNFELPHLLSEQHHHHEGLSELNLMTTSDLGFKNNVNKTLSGAKCHRRYNTIANGQCYNSASPNNAASETTSEFNLDFLNNMSNNSQSHSNYGSAQDNQSLQFLDFSNVHNTPLQGNNTASQSRMDARHHRRTKTTGNIIGLPQDWNTSVGLNTIHEETGSIPLMHECGSLMSGETQSMNEVNGSSGHAIFDSIVPPTVVKGHTRDLSSKSSLSNHTRDMSSKSSLSNDDFCAHLMAGGIWDGALDADTENDGFMVSSVEEKDDELQHSFIGGCEDALDSQSLGFSKFLNKI